MEGKGLYGQEDTIIDNTDDTKMRDERRDFDCSIFV